ncbi:alpha/beta fold hydrolase [Aliagarivorans taiwanensis]|uniref:alpha/beta fold hydrolase n=1 Tax=Aliagarivorans taiwanensis TaxID=561966 RepID=UPI0003FEAE06|nr:alpha/beta hydrolase [Aliagarivorans taiwanensis]
MRLLLSLLAALTLQACSALHWVEQGQQRALQEQGFTESVLQLNDGGELRYWVGGQGRPLLLLHGFGGTATTTWLPVMQGLADEYRIIAPDLPWFGDSYSHQPAELAVHRDAIAQLLAQLRVPSAPIMAISYGGFVALDMIHHGFEAEQLIILASPGVRLDDHQLELMATRFDKSDATAIFVPNDRQQMRELLDGTFERAPKLPGFVDEQLYQRYFEPWRDEKRAMIDTLPAYRDEFAQDFEARSLPRTLLIWGEQDQVFPLTIAKQLSEDYSAPLMVIPGANHNISNDYPDLIIQASKLFLD